MHSLFFELCCDKLFVEEAAEQQLQVLSWDVRRARIEGADVEVEESEAVTMRRDAIGLVDGEEHIVYGLHVVGVLND